MKAAKVEYEDLLEKLIATGNVYLKNVGLKLDSKDGHRRFIDRLRFRKFLIFNFICFSLDLSGQLTWLIQSIRNRNSNLIDITFLLPCTTVTLLGSVKSFSFLKYVHHIHEIITKLKKYKGINIAVKKEDMFANKCVRFLNTSNKIITWATIFGITTIGFAPLIITATTFYNTGEIKLLYPFLFYYPFDAFDIRLWPFLYAQQLWSAVITSCSIWGPDYICYAVATFIIVQLSLLKRNIVSLFPKSNNRRLFLANDVQRAKLREIVKCHNELLRCAELLELTYTKTILMNVIFSSVLICFNVFNITANNNIVLMAPYTAFLIIVLGHIFLLCCFGDMIMRSSLEVSDAIYKCEWYGAEPALVRDLIIISMRANKPCKLTAYGYSDVNLRTFTKILSTSWSYLALLQTVYNKNKIAESTT